MSTTTAASHMTTTIKSPIPNFWLLIMG